VTKPADSRAGELVSAIDIGTNSVLLLIARRAAGALSTELERATITRLGEGVDRTRRLGDDASQRTLSCLEGYAELLRQHGSPRLAVVGTSALRDAVGGRDFLDRAQQILGVRPKIIDGLEEAALTFDGALSGLSCQGPVTVFDVGGGSTEVITSTSPHSSDVQAAASLDVGSVRLFERHVHTDPLTVDELERVANDVDLALRTLAPPSKGATLVGVAGTVTTLAAVELGLDVYDPSRVHGHVMTRDSIFAVAERLAKLNVSARQSLAGLEPKRADVIVVGAEIVRRVLVWSGSDRLLVSDRGVRWGLVQRLAETAD
jgi:exopolyphosphatase/guanosine-5'-triphosphate,3'-diphosphate pyrophosphatase